MRCGAAAREAGACVMEQEVRCGCCGRLLGVIRNGQFINKFGPQVIRTERAAVTCPKCGAENTVEARSYREQAGKTRSGAGKPSGAASVGPAVWPRNRSGLDAVAEVAQRDREKRGG